MEVDSPVTIFLHYYHHIDVWNHELNILNQSDNETMELLLYGSKKFDFQQNCNLLDPAIRFILKSRRFNGRML